MRLSILIRAAAAAVLVAGCGGGGGGGGNGGGGVFRAVRLKVQWDETGRADGDARSVVFQIRDLTGEVVHASHTENRRADPGAYEQEFLVQNLPAGSQRFELAFMSQPGGTGGVTGFVQDVVPISENAETQRTVAEEGTPTAVEVVPGQSIPVGQTRPILFRVTGPPGVLLAAAPSQTSFQLVSGTDVLRIVGTQAQAVGPGTAQVRATVGSVVSPAQSITATGGASRFVGTVLDSGGQPIVGARVETSDGTRVVVASTGADGFFVLPDVPAGQRVVSFSRTGFETAFEVEIATGDKVDLGETRLQPFGGTPPGNRPVVTLDNNNITVDQASGQALVRGTATGLDSRQIVIITNGAESQAAVDQNNRFDTTVLLRPGSNSISLRAPNAAGTTVVGPILVDAQIRFAFRVTLTWDGDADLDLHVWDPLNDPNQSPNPGHIFFEQPQNANGVLDLDNTTANGPENYTAPDPAGSQQTATPGRYRVGVNSFSGGQGRKAIVRVVIPAGPNAGSYQFGPYTFLGSNAETGYPITGNTDFWYRPVDVVVAADGTVSVAPPDSASLTRAARTRAGGIKKR